MAKKLTSTELLKQLAEGKLVSSKRVRDEILNPAEINYLVLLDEQIDAIFAFLESDKGKETIRSDEKRIRLETLLATAPELEEGYLVQEDVKYATLKEYVDFLNNSPTNTNTYQLGHETAVATRILQLLKENYIPKGTPAGTRQKKLIDQAIKASLIIDSIDDNILKKLQKVSKTKLSVEGGAGGGITSAELAEVLKSAGGVLDLNVSAEKNITEKLKDKSLKIALRPELVSLNQYTGKLTQRLIGSLGAALRSGSSKTGEIDEILKNVDVFNLTGSPSILEYTEQELDAAFYGGKKKKVNKKVKSKVRVHRRIPANNDISKKLKERIKRRKAALKTAILARTQKKKFVIPTVTLKAIINESLAEFIKIRMEDSRVDPSPSYLRNITGRFAESARLLTLTRQESGAYIGTYDFQTNPYGVFLPGGRLHTQQRDPKLYIEGAARDIAVQVLKRSFNGLFLELK